MDCLPSAPLGTGAEGRVMSCGGSRILAVCTGAALPMGCGGPDAPGRGAPDRCHLGHQSQSVGSTLACGCVLSAGGIPLRPLSSWLDARKEGIASVHTLCNRVAAVPCQRRTSRSSPASAATWPPRVRGHPGVPGRQADARARRTCADGARHPPLPHPHPHDLLTAAPRDRWGW